MHVEPAQFLPQSTVFVAQQTHLVGGGVDLEQTQSSRHRLVEHTLVIAFKRAKESKREQKEQKESKAGSIATL